MTDYSFGAEGIAVTLDLSVGHIAELTIASGGRTLRPLHRAHWIGSSDVPEEMPLGQKRLSGDFLCAPFSRSDVEEAPLHGWTSNSAWQHIGDTRLADGVTATFRLEREVMGAVVEKLITLRDGHPFIYQEHRFIGGSGAISVAHHPITEMAEGGKLAFSPKRLAATPDTAPEIDPARGRSALAYPAESLDLTRFPAADGSMFDLTEFPASLVHEDFVTLVEADHGGLGWAAAAREAEEDLVLVLKNPTELPVTMLWISNGGRFYPPWNRRRGVLGIEDGRAVIGHAASLGDNWLKRLGVKTAFALGGTVSFRQVVGAAGSSKGKAPVSVTADNGKLVLGFADGSQDIMAFDCGFLRIGQPLN